jgi:hypothetical protein
MIGLSFKYFIEPSKVAFQSSTQGMGKKKEIKKKQNSILMCKRHKPLKVE